jgi:hypothetical protein
MHASGSALDRLLGLEHFVMTQGLVDQADAAGIDPVRRPRHAVRFTESSRASRAQGVGEAPTAG